MVETENVPHDLILGILSAKLPVKSLLRFKCVCKTWCSVISDPQFRHNLHPTQPSILICQNSKHFSTIAVEALLTSKNKASALTPLSLPWEEDDEEEEHYHALFTSKNRAAALTRPSLPWEDQDDEDEEEYYHGSRDTMGNRNHFIGSCNGLVCVDQESSKSGRCDLILWNPSTGKFRRLPQCSRIRGHARRYCVWFGYDESIDDYKLVWVKYHIHNRAYELNVFTLKSNTWTWRAVSHIGVYDALWKGHDRYNPRIIGVLSNGAIHWRTWDLCLRRMDIVALDLATEEFRPLSFCNYPFDTRVGVGGCCILGGCPCMYDDDDRGGGILEMVKEYRSSWRVEGIVGPNSGSRRFYQTLSSSEEEEGKEILAVIDMDCSDHRRNDGNKIVKLRVQEGGGGGVKVDIVEDLLFVPNVRLESLFSCKNNIVTYTGESFDSLGGE